MGCDFWANSQSTGTGTLLMKCVGEIRGGIMCHITHTHWRRQVLGCPQAVGHFMHSRASDRQPSQFMAGNLYLWVAIGGFGICQCQSEESGDL